MRSRKSSSRGGSPDKHIIESRFQERFTIFYDTDKSFKNMTKEHVLETEKHIPKLGVMLVGLGGNNGSTFVAGILANKQKMTWPTRQADVEANFYGSFTQCATAHVGFKYDERSGELTDVHRPVKELLPMINPCDLEISGWDISGLNLYESCKRARVLEPTLIEQLRGDLERIRPLPAALNGEFIAANQADRADNVVRGTNEDVIARLRQDIRDMKSRVEKVIVLWTANTEQYLLPEILNIEDLHKRIVNNEKLPSSVLYCVAAIEEKILYLNGSPQNTFHPGIVEYAKMHGALLAGSDFKSGQTRFKTIMSDYLIGAGLRLASVVSYNHLGNNDGKNLSEDKCFQSKKISKAGVLDDAIKSNTILYPEGKKHIDHEVVIKYVPFVGDSKRALDEYTS